MLHLQGHGDRHAEQRHAVLDSCGWTCAPSRSCCRCRRSRRSATTRCSSNDGNTFNYGYIGSRATGNDAGDYLVAGPDWKGETPPGIKKVFRSTTQFSLAGYRTQLFNAGGHAEREKVQAGYKVQPLSAFLKQPAPPAAPAIDFPKIDKELVKTNFFEYLDFALQFAPPGPEEQDDPRQAGAHRHRRRQDLRLQGAVRWSTRPRSRWA